MIDLVAILHFIGESDDPLVEPGLVQVSLWRPEVAEPRTDGIWIYGGVGRRRA